MGNSRDWDTIKYEIPSCYQVHCRDLPGHGIHKKIPHHYTETIHEISEWLKSFTGKKIIIGYSMGARLAWHVAHKFPNLLDLLVIESGSPGILDPLEQAARRQKDVRLFEPVLTGKQSWTSFLEAWYCQPIFRGLTHRIDLSCLVKDRTKHCVAALQKSINIFGSGVLPSLWPHLDNIEIPTLFLTGTEDSKYCQIAEECHKISSRIVTQKISGASHNIHLQQPKAVVNAIMNFVNEKFKETL